MGKRLEMEESILYSESTVEKKNEVDNKIGVWNP